MMANFFNKEKWTKEEWAIYLNNLNLLRLYSGLTKANFNKKIGRANLFRKDMRRPGEGTILKICQKFNVTETWLATSREDVTTYVKTHPDTLLSVAEPQAPYREKTTDFKRRRTDPAMDTGDVVRKVIRIMESDISDVKNALVQNVDTFYKAIFWAKGEPPPAEGREEKKIKQGT